MANSLTAGYDRTAAQESGGYSSTRSGVRNRTPFRTNPFEGFVSTVPPSRHLSGQYPNVRILPDALSEHPAVGTRIAGPGTLVRVTETPRRVVIAEDEALIRLDLREMLEEEG